MCSGRRRLLLGFVRLAACFVLPACIEHAAAEQSQISQSEIRGRVIIEAPVTGNAFAVITLLDVSLADASSKQIAQTKVTNISGSQFTFTLPFDAATIEKRNSYIVSAEIHEQSPDGIYRRTFLTTQSYPVLTRGAPRNLTVRVQRIR